MDPASSYMGLDAVVAQAIEEDDKKWAKYFLQLFMPHSHLDTSTHNVDPSDKDFFTAWVPREYPSKEFSDSEASEEELEADPNRKTSEEEEPETPSWVVSPAAKKIEDIEENLPDKVRSPEEYYEIVYRMDEEWLKKMRRVLPDTQECESCGGTCMFHGFNRRTVRSPRYRCLSCRKRFTYGKPQRSRAPNGSRKK